MAINYYANIGMIGSDIELNRNQLILPVIDNETTQPAAGVSVQGQMYFDTTAGDKTMYYFDGTNWISMDGSSGGVTSVIAGTGIGVDQATGAVTVSNTGVLSVDTTDGTWIDLTPNTAANGDVTVTADLSATGFAGTGNTQFLRGDNVWATPAGGGTMSSWDLSATTGTTAAIEDTDEVIFTGVGIATAVTTAGQVSTITLTNSGVTSIVAGTNITISGATGAVTINGTANTTSLGIANDAGANQFTVGADDLEFAAAGGASVAFDNTNKRVTYTAPTNTNETYTLPVSAGTAVTGFTVADVDLTAGGSGTGIKSTVTFAGKDSEIEITETVGNNGIVKIGLPDDVVVTGSLDTNTLGVTTSATVGTTLSVSGILTASGTINMVNSKILNVATGTAGTDGVNLAQVQTLVAGGSIFQGGYDAATNTPDLDTNPVTTIKTGYFWAVTESGTFFSEVVQVGDLIFANTDDPGATFANWTVVQSGQEIAEAGSVDATTVKGIAGFNDDAFTVSASGFVNSLVFSGTQKGVVPNTSGNVATVFLNGQGAFSTPANDNTQRGAGTGLSLNGNDIDANVSATAQSVTKEGVSSATGRTYELQVDGSDQLVVNVPWTDNNDDTGITGVTLATAASTGSPLSESITGRELTLTSHTYAGTTLVGYVPTGGDATKFLRGDGTWVVPTDTTGVDTVSASTADALLGLSSTPTSGDVVVGLDINGMNAVSAGNSIDRFPIYDASATANGYLTGALLADLIRSENSYKQTLTAFTTGTTIAANAVVHDLNSFDVSVHLYDENTKETIHAEIDRTSVNIVSITGNSYPVGNITVLVSKIG
jgi:hypothetical protein|tara:strand:- start:271 stop:2751 length:2481 start_codon:yes stop_codon:yes gene_type:complete